jgi:hypothetical protein
MAVDRVIRGASALAFVLVAAGCSFGGGKTASPAAPELASGKPLPAGCVVRAVPPGATVAFVANGSAWALEPKTGRVTCLFRVRRAGPFAWGPRGDRALLARLEVKGLAGAPHRPPTGVDPHVESWGRPIGKSIVFVGRGGRALLKAHPAGGGFLDVTPIRGVRYERVVYHPSGLAFAFVVRRGKHASVWISTNVGKQPRKLVHGRLHTGFEALAFMRDGSTLYFAARHHDGHVDVHLLPLGASEAPVVWSGKPGEHVSDLFAGAGTNVAFTVGPSCETRRAVVVTSGRPKGVEVLPGHRPSRTLGWVDDRHLLVATGGCGQKLDLYSVATVSLRSRLLVRGVATASVRRPEPLPPPPLPAEVLRPGSGVA